MQRIGWQGSALLMVMAACSADTDSHSDAVSGANGALYSGRTSGPREPRVRDDREDDCNDEENRVLSASRRHGIISLELQKREKQADDLMERHYSSSLAFCASRTTCWFPLSCGSEDPTPRSARLMFSSACLISEAQYGVADQRRDHQIWPQGTRAAPVQIEGGGAVQVAKMDRHPL